MRRLENAGPTIFRVTTQTMVEEGVAVGAMWISRIDEANSSAGHVIWKRDCRGPPDVLVLEQRLETVPALAEETPDPRRGTSPRRMNCPSCRRRVDCPSIGLDGRGRGRPRLVDRRQPAPRCGDESASLQYIIAWCGPQRGGAKSTEQRGDFGAGRTITRDGKLWADLPGSPCYGVLTKNVIRETPWLASLPQPVLATADPPR